MPESDQVLRERIAKLLSQIRTPSRVRVDVRALAGGLTSGAIAAVRAEFGGPSGPRRSVQFVVKELGRQEAREATIYRVLLGRRMSLAMPRLLAIERENGCARAIYLEAIVPASHWPWADERHSRALLERLAHWHMEEAPVDALGLGSWDYATELRVRARQTVLAAERAAATLLADGWLRASLPALRRLVTALPHIQRECADRAPLPLTVLHGDLHPGNVLLRMRSGEYEPVLLDWARMRIGSPLEDVSSWLQSLGYWEPSVKRRHDSLLAAYLAARGQPGLPSDVVRRAYWLAAACNALAGALRYRLEVGTSDDASAEQRAAALHAARDWLRVIRRADAWYHRPGV